MISLYCNDFHKTPCVTSRLFVLIVFLTFIDSFIWRSVHFGVKNVCSYVVKDLTYIALRFLLFVDSVLQVLLMLLVLRLSLELVDHWIIPLIEFKRHVGTQNIVKLLVARWARGRAWVFIHLFIYFAYHGLRTHIHIITNFYCLLILFRILTLNFLIVINHHVCI